MFIIKNCKTFRVVCLIELTRIDEFSKEKHSHRASADGQKCTDYWNKVVTNKNPAEMYIRVRCLIAACLLRQPLPVLVIEYKINNLRITWAGNRKCTTTNDIYFLRV
jgi:hypothetical protein